jgi:hypothetical protein
LIIIGVVCFDVCEEDEASRNGVFPPLRLFVDFVSIYSSACPYERGTPKKHMMEFVLYPSLYTKKTKRTIGDGVK